MTNKQKNLIRNYYNVELSNKTSIELVNNLGKFIDYKINLSVQKENLLNQIKELMKKMYKKHC